ncbi:GNAT family N-acetyltransferase [Methanolobus halotolerans]|uniref:N-acetyltransferase n=1 Tax=Methanolobus halotolerans TaxID=2052935 RepID=A0A4E0Q5I8_9EURY|nr:GNAT family N-acetyltransferase [Methanolobus halotolerans]TGC09440.1 N-acetyltransferase [Methanolobus halotolerans]
MSIEAIERGFVWKLHVIKRQSMTAFKLILGSLAIHRWVRVADNHITHMSDEALKDVLRLYNENFPEINEKRFTMYARSFKKTTYVYKDNDEVKGYCLYYVTSPLSSLGLKKTATLYSFTVDSRCRGQGIGTNLLQNSIHEMRLNRIDRIKLYVDSDNIAAINLYQKVGFEVKEEVMDICGLGKKCYEMEIKFDKKSQAGSDLSGNPFMVT